MKLKEFKKGMQKGIFTWEEAKLVAFGTSPDVLKLQLHQWKKAGDIISLRRGIYIFPDQNIDKIEIAKYLCWPCYLSLEYALSHYGLLPDVVFAMTLVTTKSTRKFNTPLGQFTYQKLKQEAFFGFDNKTLIAEKEKAVVDNLYLNRHRFLPNPDFWEEQRWQNLDELNFKRALDHAKHFRSDKLKNLLISLKSYAKLKGLHKRR